HPDEHSAAPRAPERHALRARRHVDPLSRAETRLGAEQEKVMAWLALRVDVERGGADALSDALLEAGAQSVALESLDGPRIVLNALFADGTLPERLLDAAAAASGVRIGLPPGITLVEDEDWVRHSQAQFSPVAIGGLWVGATWHSAPRGAAV